MLKQMKYFQNYKIAFLIFLLLIVSFVFFQFNNKSKPIDSVYFDKDSNSLFMEYAKEEVNYQYFLENKLNKVTVYFPESISQYDFTEIRFYKDNTLLDLNFKVQEVKDDSLSIVLNDFIESFNNIRIQYQNSDLALYTGLYRFEKLNNITFSDSDLDSIFIIKKHSLHDDTRYETSIEFNKELTQDKISILVPTQVLENNLLKSNTLELEHHIWKYQNECNLAALDVMKIKRFSFDVHFLAKSENAQESSQFILSTNIPYQSK